MPWVADAVFGAGGVANSVRSRRATAPTAGIGELRNPVFPSDVAVGDPWTGTIDAFNTGTETHPFRFRIDDTAEESFDLGPGGTHTLTQSGTQVSGGTNYWIFLDRWVAEAPKLPWRLIGVAAAASACVVGLTVVAVKA